MKKILFAFLLLASTTCFADEPNEKVLASFNKTFSEATEVTWHTVESDKFEASFQQDKIRLKVQYDSDGNILRSIRYYKGNVLPVYIQSRIQKKFSQMAIYSVTEITTAEDVSYHVILEDEKNWMNIRSDAYGNLSIESKFTKG